MNMVNQRICPENIALSADASELVHLELSDMDNPKQRWCSAAFQHSAYNKKVSPIEFGYNRTGYYMDRYSIGVILFELLAGTDLVLTSEKPFVMQHTL